MAIRSFLTGVTVSTLVLLAAPDARAQALPSDPYTTTIPVTFTGTVQYDSSGKILVQQPGGGLVAFTGPVPGEIYNAGEPVTISFNVVMPTKAYFDSSPYAASITRPSDGIYRIAANTAATDPLGIGAESGLTVTIGGQTLQPASPGGAVITLAYNYNTDSYAIDGSQPFGTGLFVGPGYKWDPAIGQLVSCYGADCDPLAAYGYEPRNGVLIGGNTNWMQVFTTASGILNAFDTTEWGRVIGAVFDGGWNLPIATGAATPVPEPGMLGMFGGAVLAPVLRRRRALRAARA